MQGLATAFIERRQHAKNRRQIHGHGDYFNRLMGEYWAEQELSLCIRLEGF
jgi:hypothetical protein